MADLGSIGISVARHYPQAFTDGLVVYTWPPDVYLPEGDVAPRTVLPYWRDGQGDAAYNNQGWLQVFVKFNGVFTPNCWVALLYGSSQQLIDAALTDVTGSCSFYGLDPAESEYHVTAVVPWTTANRSQYPAAARQYLTPNDTVTLEIGAVPTKVLTLDAGVVKVSPLAVVSSRYSQLVGNGSATSFTISHNLANQDAFVVVRRNSSPYDEVNCEVEYTDSNTVTLRFASAPSSNEYKVTVLG